MKATLTFTLPEEEIEYTAAVQALKWKGLVWELDQYLRSELKYNEALNQAEGDALQKVRDKLYELLRDDGLLLN